MILFWWRAGALAVEAGALLFFFCLMVIKERF